MARSDLLESLVKAGTNGDKRVFRMAAEAIIAEERAKRHDVLADRLLRAIQTPNGSGNGYHNESLGHVPELTHRGRDFVAEIVPRRRLDELILPIAARQGILDLIEEQQRADLLRAHGVEPRNRILLVGPPGTGKTTLAEAIAEAIVVPLFVVRYESMIGSYLGETAARLKRVFDYARTTPCVLFFDEFDAIGKERGDTHETGEIKRVVTSLLMQVDELPSYTIVAAATNHPELLDRAAWRRFQIRLDLPLPKQGELADYINSFLSRLSGDKIYKPLNIAKALGRVSYAEAEQFCLDVRRRQVLANGERALTDLIAEQVKIWSSASRAKQPREREGCNAGTSAPSDTAAARD
jgi:SpoVK/Ycf46/Vps4 family AAA+-type ATPase